MPPIPFPPLALALAYLRAAAGWIQARLAQALGFADDKGISAYERGAKPLTREKLESLVAPLGYPPEAIDVFLFAHALIHPEPQKEAPSPVSLSREERLEIDRHAMTAGWTAGQREAGRVRAELTRQKTEEKIEAARQKAEELFQQLGPFKPVEQRGLIEAFPDYWSWALAVRVCEASVKRAAHRPGEALELAELAVAIAERVPGEEAWRSRLLGYCWAHVANARRVTNDLDGADEGFAWAWELWRKGTDSWAGVFGAWVLPSMQASLRRAQRRFPEALELLEAASTAQGGDSPQALIVILLQKEHLFDQMGDAQSAAVVLAEAAPYIEALGDQHQLFALRFNLADNLSQLGRYNEAAKLLPQVREMAIQNRNELDLIRLVWLESRVAAGQGRVAEAMCGLAQVVRAFKARSLHYSAALASLDLCSLCLKAGRSAEVKRLAGDMVTIFGVKGIGRETLASLKLFCEAAQQETATVELAQRAAAALRTARRSAPDPCGTSDRA